MILVDVNILLYAEDSLHPHHKQARAWWDTQLSRSEPVFLCWMVLSAFIRIGTNPRVFKNPISLERAALETAGSAGEQGKRATSLGQGKILDGV